MAKQGFNLTANLTIQTLNLGSSVKKIQSALNGITGTINLKVNTTGSDITKLEQKVKSLKTLSRAAININVRAPSARTISALERTTIALRKIKPLLLALGGGTNLSFKFTGLSGSRLNNFATSLENISKKAKLAFPSLHQLNTILGQKITHLRQFQQAANAAGKSISGLGKGVGTTSTKNNINQTSSSVRNLATQTQRATSFMYDFGKSGGLAVKRFGAFTIATTVVFGFINAIGQAFREGVEFEKQLAKIAQVSSTSILGVKNLGDQVGKLAVQYGIASGQLLKINQIFAQAGLRGYELQQALSAIAKSDLAPTFTDMENTSEGLIAMMGQFKIKANDFEKALGSINAVSAEFAVESDDLITAIRIFGGVFAKASNETKPGLRQLQELLAIFTGIRDTTRESAESIATGLRTITTRLQRPRTANLLESYGINVRDVEGNFIGMYEAVEELNKKLKTMNKLSEGYAKISEEIGGYRQKGKTIPLTEQIDKMQKALRIARQGEGSLEDQMDTQLQTLGRRAVMVAEDFKKMIREIMNTESFKRIVDVVLSAAEAFVRLADAIKPILPLLSVLAVVRGGVGAFQFAKGAIDHLKHNKGAVGAGINAAQAGGVSGVGGISGAITGYFGGIRQNFQQAGYFQQSPTILTRRQIRNLSLQGTQQFTGMFSNAGPGTTQFFHPKVSNILTPAIKNLATTYNIGSRDFKTATNAIVKELYKNRDAIRTGTYSPGTAALTQIGRKAVVQDNVWWRKAGRGIGVVGRGLADRSGSLLMGGMMLAGAGGGHPATNIIGKTLSGAGIGGMMTGGPWGVAIGAVTGGVMGIVQAMGPEKIERANEAIAKSLQEVNKKFADFGQYELGNSKEALGIVIKDLETAIVNAFDMNYIDKSDGFIKRYTKQIEDSLNITSIEEQDKRAAARGFWSNILKSEIFTYGLPGVIGGFVAEPDINREQKKISQESLNRAGKIYQELAPRSKESFQYLSQIIKEEGNLYKNGELDLGKAAKIEDKYGIDIKSLLFTSALGGKNSQLAIENVAKILEGGAGSEKARKNLEELEQARAKEAEVIVESQKKVEDLVFVFDKMRLSLEQLDGVVSRVAEKNKLLASTTDQYFDNAISGPASNRIIFTKPQNPFNNIEGLDPSELRRQYKNLGITSTSQIGNTLYFGDLLNQQLPQLIEQANKSFMPKKNEFLLKELFGGTKDNSVGGLIGGMDKEIREKLREVIKDAGTGEGTIKIDDLSKKFEQIYKPIYEKSAQIASKQFEMISEQTQRIVDIVGKRLELEQRLRNDELNLIQQRQGFSEQRANLFYEESPFEKGQRLAANRAEIMARLSGGKNFTQLFGERDQLRKDLENPDIIKDEAKRKGLETALLENQNEINKLTESLQKATDVNDQLANIQQQALKIQQKREAGRTLVGRVQNMDFAERRDYERGLLLAIKMRGEGGLPTNIASKDYDRIQKAIALLSEFKESLPKAEQKAIEEMAAMSVREWNRISEVDKIKGGPVSGLAILGGTEKGATSPEQNLLKAFDTLATSAQTAGQKLIEMTEADKKRALEIFEIEKKEAAKGIKSTVIRANQAFIVRDSGKKEEVEDLGGGGAGTYAKGGKLGGSGPIPILAHGGELIIPKGKVNQGLAGVMDFAKSQGLSFAEGGRVPTLDELKKGAIDKLQQFPVEEYRTMYPDLEDELSNFLNLIQQSENKVDLKRLIDSAYFFGFINNNPEPLSKLLNKIREDNTKNMLSWREKPKTAYESAQQQKRIAYRNRRNEYLEKKYGKGFLTDDEIQKRKKQIQKIALQRAIEIEKAGINVDFGRSLESQAIKARSIERNAAIDAGAKKSGIDSNFGRIVDATTDRPDITQYPRSVIEERAKRISAGLRTTGAQSRSEQLISEAEKLNDYKQLNTVGRGLLRSTELDTSDFDKLYAALSVNKDGLDSRANVISDIIAKYPNLIGPTGMEVAKKYSSMKEAEMILGEKLPVLAQKKKELTSEEIRQRARERNKLIDIQTGRIDPETGKKPVGEKLLTYRPEYYNQRYGKGSATGFDPGKVKYATSYDFTKDEDVIKEGEKRWQDDMDRLKNRQTTSSKYISPMSAIQEAAENKKDTYAIFEITKETEESKRRNEHRGFLAKHENKMQQYAVKGQELAEMLNLGKFGWALINSGALDNNPQRRNELKNVLQHGGTDERSLRIRREQIEDLLYNRGENEIDSRLQNIAKEFGIKGIEIGKSRRIDPEEEAKIAKSVGLQEIGAAYFPSEKRIGFTGRGGISDRLLKHEYAHAIYGQKGLEKDPAIQQVIGEATDFLKERYKDPKEFERRFGPQSYSLSPNEMFSNIMMSNEESAKPYKNKILEYLRTKQNIPGFAGGTPEITRTGQAIVHKGEAILPASEITAFANAIRMATESMKGFGAGKNMGIGGVGDNGRTAVDEALIKAANTLSQINIPEKIVLEFPSAIQHQVTFNNGDILSEKISNLIGEKVNQMIQRQISSVISPTNGEVLVG